MELFDLQILVPLFNGSHFMLMFVDIIFEKVEIWDSGQNRSPQMSKEFEDKMKIIVSILSLN